MISLVKHNKIQNISFWQTQYLDPSVLLQFPMVSGRCRCRSWATSFLSLYLSGGSRLPEIGAALFRSPTSSSNSEANTDEGRLMEAACSSNKTEKNYESPFCSIQRAWLQREMATFPLLTCFFVCWKTVWNVREGPLGVKRWPAS